MYDQIRYLDRNGREVVRVNYNDGSLAAIPKQHLRGKSGRYYFRDPFVLNRSDVFVSPLDLSIERGEIERPLKPRWPCADRRPTGPRRRRAPVLAHNGRVSR